MTQFVHRANLSYQTFPLNPGEQGKTVIMDKTDLTFYPKPASQEDLGRRQDYRGFPSLLYCHNVLPTDRGLISVGYTPRTNGPSGTHHFGGFLEFSDSGDNYLLGYDYVSTTFYYKGEIGGWATAPVQGQATIPDGFTLTTINAQTYLHILGVGAFSFTTAGANRFVTQALTGVTASALKGIFASSGYLLAWDADFVYWSSLVSPVDFTPSLITGAGNSAIQDLKGSIQYCCQIKGGFLVFGEKNVVAAIYTGNPRYPFTFREVSNTGGFSSRAKNNATAGGTDYFNYVRDIAFNGMGNENYIFTQAGMQKISISGAESCLGEVADHITRRRVEDFDELTNSFIEVTCAVLRGKKITYVADRYLIISYAITETTFDNNAPLFTHALVFDFLLGKWGKLKFTHTWVLTSPVSLSDTAPNRSIALITSEGDKYYINLDPPLGSGVAIFGRFQYARNLWLDLQEVSVERDAMNVTVYDFPSLDGKNLLPAVEGFLDSRSGGEVRFLFSESGVNHTIALVGRFDLNSLLLTFSLGGRR